MRKLFTPTRKESLSVDEARAGRIDKLARAAKDIEKVNTLVKDVDQMELTLVQSNLQAECLSVEGPALRIDAVQAI